MSGSIEVVHLVHKDGELGAQVLNVWSNLDNANEAAANAFRDATGMEEGSDLVPFLNQGDGNGDEWEFVDQTTDTRIYVKTFAIADQGADEEGEEEGEEEFEEDDDPSRYPDPPPEDEDAAGEEEFEAEEEEEEAEQPPASKRKKM